MMMMMILTETVGLHAASDIDRISKQTISRHRTPDDSAHHWSTVDTNAHLQAATPKWRHVEAAHVFNDVQRHVGQVRSMVAIGNRDATGHHVRVANSLHLHNN